MAIWGQLILPGSKIYAKAIIMEKAGYIGACIYREMNRTESLKPHSAADGNYHLTP